MNYIKSGNTFTVVIGNSVHTFDQSHKNYDLLVDCIKNNEDLTFLENINEAVTISDWSEGNFVYQAGNLYYFQEKIDDAIVEIIREMIEGGFNHSPILKFLERLFNNPAKHVVDGLYAWLKHKSLAITEDGYFLAYKSVSVYNGEPFIDQFGREVKSGDSVDSYTRRIRNNPGDINSMPRRFVNDNRDVACSHGFHVGTMSYINDHYKQDKTIICKVDPANVVSIPSDCNNQKIRCCEYVVVSDMKRELKIVEHNYEDDYNDCGEECDLKCFSDCEALGSWASDCDTSDDEYDFDDSDEDEIPY